MLQSRGGKGPNMIKVTCNSRENVQLTMPIMHKLYVNGLSKVLKLKIGFFCGTYHNYIIKPLIAQYQKKLILLIIGLKMLS